MWVRGVFVGALKRKGGLKVGMDGMVLYIDQVIRERTCRKGANGFLVLWGVGSLVTRTWYKGGKRGLVRRTLKNKGKG